MTAANIIASGGKAQAYAASVDDFERSAAMVAAIEADHGAIGILINNAGIASRGQSVVDTDPAEMRRMVATRSSSGFGAPYNMGKTAMEALAYTPAREERDHGIRVSIGAPGLVVTDMGQRLIHAGQGVEDIRTLDEFMPFGRVCQPADVVGMVRFSVSNENPYLNGECLDCGGGRQNLR